MSLLLSWAAFAALGQPPPVDLVRDVTLEQKLDAELPFDLAFTDEEGRQVSLRETARGRPAVLALVYYDCPMLCTMVLDGLVSALKVLKLVPGKDFEVVALSIDPREGPTEARKERTSILNRYGRLDAKDGFHFLTGKEQDIRAVADAIGFRYAFDEKLGQYAHAAGITVITPAGRVARYFYGIEYPPKDLRLALVEASEGKIGSLADALLLYCYHYDPTTGRYGLVIMNVIRLAGFFTVGVLGLLIGGYLAREKRALKAQEV